MGIKEYIVQKNTNENAPKHPISKIEFCYAHDGSFIAPYAYNADETKMKDLQSAKIVEISQEGPNIFKNKLNALSQLYGIDAQQITYDDIPFMIKCFTYGHNVPGKIFKSLRSGLFWNDCSSWTERNEIIDEHIRPIQGANYEDLRALTKLLAKNIAKEYTENNKHKPTKDDLNEHSKF